MSRLAITIAVIATIILLYFIGSNASMPGKKVMPPAQTQTHSKEDEMINPKDANLIIDDIWLGNWNASIDEQFLRKNKITRVLCLNNNRKTAKDEEMYSKLGIEHKHLSLFDDPRETLPLDESYEFIRTRKGPILVHCTAGVSRSASIVCMWLMRTQKINYIQAYEYVKQRRPIIYPNEGFAAQLIKASP